MKRHCRLICFEHHAAAGDDRQILSFPAHRSHADRHRVISFGHGSLDPVKVMALEADDRVGIADRGQEKPLSICRGCRNYNFKPWKMNESAMVATRMAGTASRAGAELVAHDQGDRDAPAGLVIIARRMGRDLVHTEWEEITELDLDHRPHPVDRRANGKSHHARLGDWRVAHPTIAEFLQETSGHSICPAEQGHILAYYKDARIPRHLVAQRLSERLLKTHLLDLSLRHLQIFCLSHEPPPI